MLVSLRVCLERTADRSLGKTNMCKHGREQKAQQGLLVSSQSMTNVPLGLFPIVQIVLQIDAGLGLVTDIARPRAVCTGIPHRQVFESWIWVWIYIPGNPFRSLLLVCQTLDFYLSAAVPTQGVSTILFQGIKKG